MAYINKGPLDCSVSPDSSQLKGRSAIVTGGASGLGEAYVEALVGAGVYVTVGDLNEKLGEAMVDRFPGKVQFVKSDVTSWSSLVTLFKAAIAASPAKSLDIVIANAGVSGPDDVWKLDDPHSDPIEPNLRITFINTIGVLYTAKLAMHYFRIHPVSDERDRLLIIQGSLAGYLDQPGSPQYAASKYGCRGVMKSLRRTVGNEDMRVNFIGPWFVKTPIMSEAVHERLVGKGIKFAKLGDAGRAVLRLAGDKDVNGRAIAIVPRETAKEGYMDIDRDDYAEGDPMKIWQDEVVRVSHRVAESNALKT